MKKILIADDHYVVRMALTLILEAEFSFDVIEYAKGFNEVITHLKNQDFDIIILDINMPDTLYTKMINNIKLLTKDIKILVFSAYEETVAIQYIDEGVNGFLNKFANEKEIITALKSIKENGYYYPHQVILDLAQRKKEKNPIDLLSKREFQVFKLLTEGNGNLEICTILNLEMSTISTYKRRIFAKLNVKTIVELLKINNQLH